jgi:hypothetical protein
MDRSEVGSSHSKEPGGARLFRQSLAKYILAFQQPQRLRGIESTITLRPITLTLEGSLCRASARIPITIAEP